MQNRHAVRTGIRRNHLAWGRSVASTNVDGIGALLNAPADLERRSGTSDVRNDFAPAAMFPNMFRTSSIFVTTADRQNCSKSRKPSDDWAKDWAGNLSI